MPEIGRPRLLLLDGHSLAYRAFFALPVENFSTTTGQHTNAVYGFTSMLVNVLRDEKPTHVAVAFDVSRQTFRLAEYSEYKAKRNKTPPEFSSQLPLIEQVLTAFGITFLKKEGYEADDIIATLTTQAVAAGMQVLILTGDRDSLQLVSDDATVLYPMRGVSDLARMTPEAVEAKYGVPPGRYPELAAIVGETSDNLPGVPGVGQGFAAKWINQFDGLDNVIAHADQITGKKGEALREHLGDVIRNRHLNALVCDLDLERQPGDLVLEPWDRHTALTLFDDLEFRGELRTRTIDTLGPEEDPVEEGGFELAGRRLGPGEVADFLSGLGEQHVGVHVRGSWGSGTGAVDGIAVADASGLAAYVDVAGLTPEDDTALADWLADPARPKVLHDVKGPKLALAAHGWTLEGLVSDTALAAYLVQPDQRSYDLSDLTLRYLRRELRTESEADQDMLFDEPVGGGDDVAATAMLHARAIIDLAEALDGEVEAAGGTRLLAEIELPLVRVLEDMERIGIAVDTDHLEQLESHFAAEVRQAADEAFAVIGKEINLGSPKQLQVVLFDELDMPKTKRTKTGYTTDADALQQLYEKTEHPFLLHLLRHRDVARLRQTIEGLLKTVAPDGRIHTTFNQMIAATGRLSSTDPNLQNIPIRTEEGRRIREGFVVGDGLRLPDDGRLQPDRDADHGPPVRGQAADRGVQVGPRLPLDHRRAGLRRRRRRRHRRDARQDQGDELRPGLRPVGVRARPAAADRPGEARGLMDEYFETFGGDPRLPPRRRRRGPQGRLHRDDHGPAPLPARPDQRQPAAPRDGRADGAQRAHPGLGRRPDQGRDARRRAGDPRGRPAVTDAAPGPRRARVRGGAGGARRARPKLVRERMGGAADLTVPLDVSVGTGRSWHEAAH